MGAKGKISIVIVLLIVVGLSLWELTKPQPLPSVGPKYLSNSPYATSGSWVEAFDTGSGRVYLAFSIANLTYPRSSLSTTYSVVISKVNETLTGSLVKSLTIRVTNLKIEDNYDLTSTSWGKTNALPDAVQVTGLVFFRTIADHQLRFTITFELYNLYLFGYSPDRSESRAFNITQTII